MPRRGPVRRLRRWWYRTPTGHVAAVLTCAGIIVLVGVLMVVH